MKFEAPKFEERKNPNIPHDVNHLREFKVLLGYLTLTLVVLWLLVEGLIRLAPRFLSIELERQWFAGVGTVLVTDGHSRQDSKMQALADGLARHMGLPENSISVYISSASVPNAYATFGGHVLIYQGLLDELLYEESVAAVLAHEIAHIKHRDPLRAMSRTLFYSAIAATFGSDSHLQLLSGLEDMRYSRELEEAADEAAIHALARYYGSAGGAESLFNTFKSLAHKKEESAGDERDSDFPLTWLSTHPDTADRLARIREIAKEHGYSMNAPRLSNKWHKG